MAKGHGEAFIFGRSDWQYVLNTFCFGYNVGYKFIQTTAVFVTATFSALALTLVSRQCRRKFRAVWHFDFQWRIHVVRRPESDDGGSWREEHRKRAFCKLGVLGTVVSNRSTCRERNGRVFGLHLLPMGSKGRKTSRYPMRKRNPAGAWLRISGEQGANRTRHQCDSRCYFRQHHARHRSHHQS